MENDKKINRVRAAGEGVIAVAVLVAVLTVGGELWTPLKDALRGIFTHHWLGKSILALAAFVLIFLIRARVRTDAGKARMAVIYAAGACLLSSAVMLGYFVAHTFHLF